MTATRPLTRSRGAGAAPAALTAVLALALSLVLAGCGSDRDATGNAGTPTPASAEDAALDYAACMRENGVDMADPDSSGMIRIDGEAQSDPDWAEASAACEEILAAAAPQGASGGLPEEAKESLLAFAACMREHGVDMPDPDFSSGDGMVQLGGEGFDPMDPAVQEARLTCEQQAGLPAPGAVPGE